MIQISAFKAKPYAYQILSPQETETIFQKHLWQWSVDWTFLLDITWIQITPASSQTVWACKLVVCETFQFLHCAVLLDRDHLTKDSVVICPAWSFCMCVCVYVIRSQQQGKKYLGNHLKFKYDISINICMYIYIYIYIHLYVYIHIDAIYSSKIVRPSFLPHVLSNSLLGVMMRRVTVLLLRNQMPSSNLLRSRNEFQHVTLING